MRGKVSNMMDVVRDRIRLHGAYQRVFDGPDGETVLRHLMHIGHVTSSTFVRGDMHETAMQEGERRLVLSVLKFVRHDHAELIKQIERGIDDNEPIT